MKRTFRSCTAILSIFCAGGLLLSGCAGPASNGGATTTTSGATAKCTTMKSASVSVGYQPFAAGNSPTVTYMKNHDLFQANAKKLCYDLNVSYNGYPAAAPMIPEMIAGRLDFGMWGDTPTINAVAQHQPLTIISVGEGHMAFVLVVRKDSGITNVRDLRNKTVGVTLGGDPELALLGMLKASFGTSDVSQLGIKLVNTPSPAIAATVPKGVDAAVAIEPAYLKQRETDKGVIAIANSYGYTEAGYHGRLGTGAGHEYPEAKNSVFAPQGTYAHRSMWLTRNSLIQKEPGVVSAFLAAEQQAVSALSKMKPEDVAKSVQADWKLTPADGATIVKNELLFSRGFSWATESDAATLSKISTIMKDNEIITSAVSYSDIENNMRQASAVAKTAYTLSGASPSMKAFDKTNDDARGKPTWEIASWAAPSAVK